MRVKYNEEGLREELRSALLVIPRTKGQLDGFENNGSSDARFQRSSYRTEVGENGEELAKVKPQVVTTLACKQFKRSPMPLPPQAFKHAKLVHDMNSAPEHIGDWLRFCYSEGAQCPTKVLLSVLLAFFYEEESKSLSDDSKDLIQHLALLACMQKRDALNASRMQLTQVEIAKLAEKKQKAWEKSWAKRWNRLIDILNRFDKEGLDHVHERGRSRKATRRHADVPMQSVLRAVAREYVAA
ncbi:bacteriophage antitermination protein Q [Vibrio scophthalmi]|uniref:bacteriophage antitermination protein Q n=1 Tax=Vibrio scophthalmi TaxID=45658 RepID=UPI002283E10D|nr:bacteriophage antitermination protein Q [Vibrio scophthalmi]MCY9805500.1 bacteriophage antitermination protein Q [Vibrio scophthalmi]